MKYEEIEKIIQKKDSPRHLAQISFRTRASVKGIFIKSVDYHELSRKNLWRIVTITYLDDYNKSGDENLARIFNGADFTGLEMIPR